MLFSQVYSIIKIDINNSASPPSQLPLARRLGFACFFGLRRSRSLVNFPLRLLALKRAKHFIVTIRLFPKKLRHIIGLFFGNRLFILSGEDNPNYKGVKPPKLAFCIILPFSDEKTRITRAYSLQNENFG